MFGENILVIEELIILLLLIASVVAILSRHLRIPYTVGLVLIGLALTLLIKIEFEISPQIILALLGPPLVFELLSGTYLWKSPKECLYPSPIGD